MHRLTNVYETSEPPHSDDSSGTLQRSFLDPCSMRHVGFKDVSERRKAE